MALFGQAVRRFVAPHFGREDTLQADSALQPDNEIVTVAAVATGWHRGTGLRGP